MKKIAEAANVSVSTVSRVLSGNAAISEARAAEIRAIAASMGYGRKQRGEAKGSCQVFHGLDIGIISLCVSEDLLAVPTVAKAINGAEAALSEAGAHVLLCHVPDVFAPPPMLRSRKLDGVILFGPLQGDELGKVQNELLTRLRKVPGVWALGRPNGCWGDGVSPASFRTGAKAAEYLVSRGHRNLAFINPKPDHLHFTQREDGFVSQARRLGANVQSFCKAPEEGWSLPLHAPMSVDVVQGLVDEMLAARPRPTAVFVAADTVAALVYAALNLRNLQVGKDISMISANNDEALIASLRPGLTTFDVHARELGRLAVQQLAMRLIGIMETPEVEIRLDATLVERDSVAQVAAD